MWEPGEPTLTWLDDLFPILRSRCPDLSVDRGWLANPRDDDNDHLWTFWIEDRRHNVQVEPGEGDRYLVEGMHPDQVCQVSSVEDAVATILAWLAERMEDRPPVSEM